MSSAGSVEELIILSFGLTTLMGVAFLWLSLRDEKTSNTSRVGLMQMGMLFMVNALVFVVYYLRSNSDLGFSPQVISYLLAISSSLNLLTMIQIGILFTIFPMPILKTRKNSIILAGTLIGLMCAGVLVSNLVYGGEAGIYLVYTLGAMTGLGMAAIITCRWYLLYRRDDDPYKRNVAISAAFLFFAFIGSGIMNWPNIVFFDRPDIFAGSFMELGNLDINIIYMMHAMNGPFVAMCLFTIIFTESVVPKEKRDLSILFLSISFFVFGMADYLIQILVPRGNEFLDLWNYFIVTGTFGLVRPLILIIVALRFNLFDLTNSMVHNRSRIIALLIITVWAASFFEIIQAFIPMPQLLSAALIGVFLAFAIGWEDKMFNQLADRADEQMLPIEEDIFEDEDPYRLMMLTFAITIIVTGLAILVGGTFYA